MSGMCMGGYKSALKWWYKENSVVMDAETDSWLDSFILGYKKLVQDKKQRGIMSMTEGKAPLSYAGYTAISRHMMTMKPEGNKNPWNEGLFAWAFMVLSWNLLSRSENVGELMLQHINWSTDSMTIQFARHKGDQTGEGRGYLKHLYANPFQPTVCPILACAVFIFSNFRSGSIHDQKFFGGDRQEARFLKILAGTVEVVSVTSDLGAPKKDIGSHSNRKGSISFLLSLCHCITAVMVNLRAGWSLGNVQDRYIFAGPGGDQLCGRAICGLSVNSREFSVLPPHFSCKDLLALQQIGWSNILDGYDNYPECFKRVIPFLLASLLFHEAWLRSVLPPGHPIWSAPIFCRLYQFPHSQEQQEKTLSSLFTQRIILCFGCCEDTKMGATGIPEHLIIANELGRLTDRVAALAWAQKITR